MSGAGRQGEQQVNWWGRLRFSDSYRKSCGLLPGTLTASISLDNAGFVVEQHGESGGFSGAAGVHESSDLRSGDLKRRELSDLKACQLDHGSMISSEMTTACDLLLQWFESGLPGCNGWAR